MRIHLLFNPSTNERHLLESGIPIADWPLEESYLFIPAGILFVGLLYFSDGSQSKGL